ncbi:MAG: hypothetical protein OXG38_01970 [Chloroflexi bacterium]|nr:hypothetical protein [Chloroflexota bacterium]
MTTGAAPGEAPGGPRGTIYDLRYRPYEGERLGRRFAVWSLYVLSLRHAFGLGRGALPKTLAFGLVGLAFIPAIIQLAVAALAPGDFEIVDPVGFYSFIQIIIMLFAAALASDLVGNDRRFGVLPLYFSRPLRPDDYGIAKLAALASAMLAVTVLPQVVMFAGNWLGAADAWDWAKENAGEFGPIVGSGLMICATFAAIGLLTATYAGRRSLAIVGVLAVFLVPFMVVEAIMSISDADAVRYAIFFSPAHVVRAFTLVLFDAVPALDSGSDDNVIAQADMPDAVLVIAALLYAGVGMALALYRFRSST